jgi:O-methyltransferase involved in polyketide biosynthesis
VSFSSQLIAAARAAEGEEKDALFIDPYAAILAGELFIA